MQDGSQLNQILAVVSSCQDRQNAMNVPGSGVNRETTVIVVFPKEGPREPQEIVSNRS